MQEEELTIAAVQQSKSLKDDWIQNEPFLFYIWQQTYYTWLFMIYLFKISETVIGI